MAKMIFSLLPTRYDSLDDLCRRRNALVAGNMVDGIPVDKSDVAVQKVIQALNSAIQNRRDNPRVFAAKEKIDRSNCGKTARNKVKENYRSHEDRKKAKSEQSQAIRQAMQSGKGK